MFNKVYLIILSCLLINFDIITIASGNSDNTISTYKSCDVLFYIHCNMAWDFLNILKDINKIRVLGSSDSKSISHGATLEDRLSGVSALISGARIHILFNDIDSIFSDNKYVVFSRIINLIYPLFDIFTIHKHIEVLKNAEKIASYNKETNRSLLKTKFIQYGWLTVNKLAPYLLFAWSRKSNENINFFNIFKKSENLNLKSYEIFEIAKSLTHISEALRKHMRFKAELGNSKNHNVSPVKL